VTRQSPFDLGPHRKLVFGRSRRRFRLAHSPTARNLSTYSGASTSISRVKYRVRDIPEAILLSLKAAMYHSQVFLIKVKHTIANSLIYILMSPSNLICLALFLNNCPRAVKKVSRACSPCPNRKSQEVVPTTPVLRSEASERSLRSEETSSEVRASSLARNR